MELLDDPMVHIVGPEVSEESAGHPTGLLAWELAAGWINS
jgi:hypothetical protein